MSEQDVFSASRVLTTQIKGGTGFTETRSSSSSGRLPSEESIDCQRSEREDPTISDRIRQAIVADKGLSLYAQNIEISVGPKGVTLYGSVKSREERIRIESGAAAVVKDGKLFNKLVVRPSHNFGQAESLRLRGPKEESGAEPKCDRIRRLWRIRQS